MNNLTPLCHAMIKVDTLVMADVLLFGIKRTQLVVYRNGQYLLVVSFYLCDVVSITYVAIV